MPVQIVSTNFGGGVSDGAAHNGGVSQSGRYIVYDSVGADILGGGADSDVRGVYVKDMETGIVERIDRSYDGGPLNGEAGYAAISPNGQYVVYTSAATNIVAGDDNNAQDVFIYDRFSQKTTLISKGLDGTSANGESLSLTVFSENGRYFSFISGANDISTDDWNTSAGTQDIYVYDMQTGNKYFQTMSYNGSGIERLPTVVHDVFSVENYGDVIYGKTSYDNVRGIFWETIFDNPYHLQGPARRFHAVDGNDSSFVQTSLIEARGFSISASYGIRSGDEYVLANSVYIYDQRPLELRGMSKTSEMVLATGGRYLVYSSNFDAQHQVNTEQEQLYVLDLATGALRWVLVNSGPDPVAFHNLRISADGRWITFDTTLGKDGDSGKSDVYRLENSLWDAENSSGVEWDYDGQKIDGTPGADVLLGTSGADNVNAMAGDDKVLAGAGRDVIYGKEGADTLAGEVGDDAIFGGADNDVLEGGFGKDILKGEDGDDQIYGDQGSGEFEQEGDGEDRIWGGAGDDKLFGAGGDDLLAGDAGRDTILGGDGDDYLYGGEGDDQLLGGIADDVIYGGTGDHINSADPQAINENDTIQAGWGHDEVYAEAGDDLVWGQGGDDKIVAGYGNDTVHGGTGRDEISGSYGNDSLNGGVDEYGEPDRDHLEEEDYGDTISGGAGDDYILGGAGFDTLSGDEGFDTILGGDDGDSIEGGAGSDTLYGDAGDDVIWAASRNGVDNPNESNMLIGDVGNDSLYGSAGADHMSGGQGQDVVHGLGGDDAIFLGDPSGYDVDDGGKVLNTATGDSGDDLIWGSIRMDVVDGGSGDDVIRLDGGDDFGYGDAGADTIDGGAGNDTLNGGQGDDVITGGSGDDSIRGGEGNDTLDGGAGDDVIYAHEINLPEGVAKSALAGAAGLTLIGGEGRDTFVLSPDADNVSITDLKAEDQIDLSDVLKYRADTSNPFQTGELTLVSRDGGTALVWDRDGSGQAPAQEIAFFQGVAKESVTGANFKEVGGVVIDPNTKPPIVGTSGADVLKGTEGDDVIRGAGGADVMRGGGGRDQLFGDNDDDNLYGEAGNDTLSGGAGADNLDGGDGDDSLSGGLGGDVLRGGAGNDTISGDYGNDTLYGLAGDDVFIATHDVGQDQIRDFKAGPGPGDRLDIRVMQDVHSFADLADHLSSDASGNAVVRIDTNITITLFGVKASQLDAGDFIFA